MDVYLVCDDQELSVLPDGSASCSNWSTRAVDADQPQLTSEQYEDIFVLTLGVLVLAFAFRELYKFILNK